MTHEELTEISERVSKKTGKTVRYDGVARFSEELVAARFFLPNGLRVVVMRDSRAPVFAYQTWFRVGSRDEDSGRTGLAHLFEHLMFKGTTRHPAGEFDREMELRGAQTNAATWVDWTYYTVALAARGGNLDLVIDFESDRMTNLLLDEETFRSELEVVKNERRMSIDDSVTGTLSSVLYKEMFGEHPYSWPTIGSMEHLNASTLEDLREFYRANYAPNNATIVLVGDLDPEESLSRIVGAYGDIPSETLRVSSRGGQRRASGPSEIQVDLPVAIPHICVGYPGVAQGTDAYPALELVCEALVNGESSRLYRRLVIEEELALDVCGYVTPFAEPGLVEFFLQPRPGVSVKRLLDQLKLELLGLGGEGALTSEEVDKARNSLELANLIGLKDAEGCAEALGQYESNYGDFSLAFRLGEGWEKVTTEDCRELARRVFEPAGGVSVISGESTEGEHDEG